MLAFGLCHGMGLATKLMALSVSRNGLLVNLIGLNIGVEIGQVIVLFLVVSLLNLWRGGQASSNGRSRPIWCSSAPACCSPATNS